MKSIADEMMKNFGVKKVQGGVNSPFNDAVDRVRKAIPDQKWSFPRWCGYLRKVPVQKIHEFISLAEKSENVGRHFNWLVKNYKDEETK